MKMISKTAWCMLLAILTIFTNIYGSDIDEKGELVKLELVQEKEEESVLKGKTIIVDPGHGGFDPGRPGVNGADEKDLNLKIARRLKDYLEKGGAKVVMTRTEDEDLDGMAGAKHKRKDMAARRRISEGGDILISIHQNAFSQTSVKGAQTFYNGHSEQGRLLAALVQKSIQTHVDTTNTRKVKSSNSYYVINATTMPAVIIECGFLTNPEEEKKLNSEAYQDKMAQGIYIGIIAYFSGESIG